MMYVLPDDLEKKFEVADKYLYMNDEYEWVWKEDTPEEVKRGWEEVCAYNDKMTRMFNMDW